MFSKVKYRVFDVVVALLLLLLFSPILVVETLVLALFQGGIFADNSERIGLNGKRFRMYKFRSMIPNAHLEIQTNPKYSKLKKVWLKKKLSIDEDPRITTIGRIIRRLDIDELPQLFNVLKGEMSIVGPRPFYPEEFVNLTQNNKKLKKISKRILSVKPGITGLWQVSGRNRNTAVERFKLDFRYVQKQSIFLNLVIILKTPFVILEHIIKGEQY